VLKSLIATMLCTVKFPTKFAEVDFYDFTHLFKQIFP